MYVVRYAGDLGAVTEIWGEPWYPWVQQHHSTDCIQFFCSCRSPSTTPPPPKKSKLLYTNNISCLYAVNLTENLARLVSKQHCQGVECDGCGKQHKSWFNQDQCTMHWQITQILLMLAPSVVTPQNQYFPANDERMSVHCLESGWKIHPPRPSRLPSGNLSGLGVQNPCPREISRAEGGVFSNASRLEAVYGHSFSISREVLILWCDNRWR